MIMAKATVYAAVFGLGRNSRFVRRLPYISIMDNEGVRGTVLGGTPSMPRPITRWDTAIAIAIHDVEEGERELRQISPIDVVIVVTAIWRDEQNAQWNLSSSSPVLLRHWSDDQMKPWRESHTQRLIHYSLHIHSWAICSLKFTSQQKLSGQYLT